jgi:MYXO-CTERM domain-containing protein
MKLITNVLITAATAALSAQAGLCTFTVTMAGGSGGGGGVFDTVTHVGTIGGSVYITPGSAAKADIVDCITGTHVTDLSLTVIPAPPGSFNVFFGGPLALSPGEYTRFANTNLCVELIDGNGVVLSHGTIVPCPEPEVYAGAAGLALAGFALWRRRKA